MTLQDLLAHAQRTETGVPDWMLGFFKRRSISFANGETDSSTHVCWFQSRNFTIDLRLPLAQSQPPPRTWGDYSADELAVLANHEGWEALSEWDGEKLRWHSDTSLQLHNRWPEPALLQRIGNCMIEFAPTGAYVEDWRLQPSRPGPLIGLRLIDERDVKTGELRHSGGGLIVCGDYAALVLGRAEELTGTSLREEVAKATGDAQRLDRLFNFETSVASGSIQDGYRISLSTNAARIGEALLPLDGFEYLSDQRQVVQRLVVDGIRCERRFVIDTIEPQLGYEQATGFTPQAQAWYASESPTLTRYTEPHF
ncbi:hypothetical protein SAMN05216421_1671 [Halopseudomonas xinjiangensis]|uniref:Uncharacterized protein n=1 Tax=Halopseudomonas xinjiangensis TaxID=487184 RepID=A0A1H1SV47_9GAMM|nr:hypothetical protein [Halopseudomonas xinjiangensis]SDS51835.1 hypothetical protein SAMN05216421_1671 [Halopseudomonas xinjiangensis]